MSSDKPTIKVTLSIREVPAAVLLRMLEECEYVCEAGKLEMNTAYIELKRRAQEEAEQEKIFPRKLERALLIAVLKNAHAFLEYIYEFEQIPDNELQMGLHDSIQHICSLLHEDVYDILKEAGYVPRYNSEQNL